MLDAGLLPPWRLVLIVLFTLIYGCFIGNERGDQAVSAVVYSFFTAIICTLAMYG